MTVHDALGRPVVPDEKTIHRGGRTAPVPVRARRRRGGLLPPDCAGTSPAASRGTTTVAASEGMRRATARSRRYADAPAARTGSRRRPPAHRRFELSQRSSAAGPNSPARTRTTRHRCSRSRGTRRSPPARGQVADDTVSGPDAERAQGRGERPGLPHQLGPRHRLPVAGLALVHHGGPVGSGVAHHVVDVVEPACGNQTAPCIASTARAGPGSDPEPTSKYSQPTARTRPRRPPTTATAPGSPGTSPRAAFDPAREVGDAGAGDVLVGRHPLRPGTDGSFTGHKSPLPCPGDARAAHDLLRVP